MMDADNDASIRETQKLGIRASSISAPVVQPESAISATKAGTGSQEEGGEAKRWNVVARATAYGHTYALLVPEAMIPKHERRDDVIEARVARISEPRLEYPLYTTHLPGYRRAYLDLFLTKPQLKEEFVIGMVRRYLEPEFAAGYNAALPKGLENTRLVWTDRFRMGVEGTDVELAKAKFRTYQGQVVLDGELGEAGPIKVVKALDSFSVRLKDHSPVVSIRRSEGATVLKYRRTDHDSYPHTRLAAALMPRTTIPTTSDIPFQILARPSGTEGVYRLLVSEKNRLLTEARLRACNSRQAYTTEKGDISEGYVERLLRTIGFQEVKHHPFGYGLGSSRDQGPDFVAREDWTRLLYLVEAKWWGDVEDSASSARDQVKDYCKKYTSYRDEPIMGAYIATMEWDVRTTLFRIMVERAS